MLDCSDFPVAAFEDSYWPIMQFTGLKDKNDTEIYEGDILRWHYMEEGVGVVKYSDRYASFEPFNQLRFDAVADTFEVIGNIYENPELLP